MEYKCCCLILIWIFYLSIVGTNGSCPKNRADTSRTEDYNGYCYQFVNKEEYWTDASDYCIKNGGSLVRLSDADTNKFVTDVLRSLSSWTNNGVWIGLTDKGGELTWKWATKQVDTYTEMKSGDWSNWGKGHPGGFLHSARDCIRMVRDDNWKWHETTCSTFNWKYKFICQYELPPTVPTPELHHALTPRMKPTTKQQTLTVNKQATAASTANIETGEALKDFVTEQSNPIIVDKASNEAQELAGSHESPKPKMWAIIGGCLGAVIFILIVIIMVLIQRRHSKRFSGSNFSSNPMYEGPDPILENTANKRVATNIYEGQAVARSDAAESVKKIDEKHQQQEADYLTPKSLVNISETYLTTNVAGLKNIPCDPYEMNQANNVYEEPRDFETVYDEIPCKAGEK